MMTEKKAWLWLAEQMQIFHLHTFSVHTFADVQYVTHIWIKTDKYTLGSYGLCRHIEQMLQDEMIDFITSSNMLKKIDVDLKKIGDSWLFECNFAGLLQRIIYCKRQAEESDYDVKCYICASQNKLSDCEESPSGKLMCPECFVKSKKTIND